jgi:hypothetical protein
MAFKRTLGYASMSSCTLHANVLDDSQAVEARNAQAMRFIMPWIPQSGRLQL